jgi:hypothetical protein
MNASYTVKDAWMGFPQTVRFRVNWASGAPTISFDPANVCGTPTDNGSGSVTIPLNFGLQNFACVVSLVAPDGPGDQVDLTAKTEGASPSVTLKYFDRSAAAYADKDCDIDVFIHAYQATSL